MEIQRQTEAGVATFLVSGRLDASWCAPLTDALQKAVRDGFHEVRLNLAELSFLSSAGIRVLMTHWKELRKVQGQLHVLSVSGDVERTLRLAGLQALLDKPVATEPAATSAKTAAPRTQPFSAASFTGDIEELAPSGRWQGRLIGSALGTPPNLTTLCHVPLERVPLSAGTLALGFGAFGNSATECSPRLGELLAVQGSAICLPADGGNLADYEITEGDLAPDAHLAQGLVAQGGFSHFARFEAAQDDGAPYADLLTALINSMDVPSVAFAAVVECAALVGACLRRTPDAPGADKAFGFPQIRDWVTFTAEPAYANTVVLLTGVVTKNTSGPLAAFTRPINRAAAPRVHVHAAAFPYRPVRHGRLDLGETVTGLFEAERVLGVLHLLSDLRPELGAGESRFFRGALWAGPLEI